MPADQGAPPPLPHRRPRVREVSSRFLSPVTASSCAGDLHSVSVKSPLPKSKHAVSIPAPERNRSSKTTPERWLHQQQEPLSCCANENIPETIRSLDTPFVLSSQRPSNDNNSNNGKIATFSTQRRHRAVKLFKENGHGEEINRAEQQQQSSTNVLKSCTSRTAKCSRPDTPTAATRPTEDRIVPSRFRLPKRQASSSVTNAAKLLHTTGLSLSSSNVDWSGGNNNDALQDASSTPPLEAYYHSDGDTVIAVPENPVEFQPSSSNVTDLLQGSSCPNSPRSPQKTRTWPETRASMPEGDMLPSLSTRFLVRSSSCSSNINPGNCQTSSKFSTPSLCSRSLNLPLSSSQHPLKSSERPSSTLFKPSTPNPLSMEYHILPPQPAIVRPGVDSRKGRKPLTSLEEVHSLRLLHNHHLMWRYSNAKGEASMRAQKAEVESQFFSLEADISHLRDAVKRKRVELALLRRTKALSTILEAHMPHLDEWSALEEEYTDSLSGATNALVNSLIRLPVGGNTKVNIKEAAEALDSAVRTMEMIVVNMQNFMPKAEEMDTLISELATVIDGEKALIEECGSLLSMTHSSQVEDCSLRGHLMQLHSGNLF